MKVCNVVKNSIWYDPRVRKQIQEYVRNDIEITCVGVRDLRYDEDEIVKIPCKISIIDIDPKYYGAKRTLISKIIRELQSNIRIYQEIFKIRPDIIHANDLNALVPVFFASKKLKCKVIYDTHEIFIENLWIANKKIVKFIWWFLEKSMIKKINGVVCVSNASADYISEKYNIKRPLVVTNCISKESQKLILKSKSSKFEILNHGQFYEGRGYDLMVQAASLLKEYSDISFVLRGFGIMENKLRSMVYELDIKSFSFAPPVKTNELIFEASSSMVGIAITEDICLNFKLSISNKIFEYAAAGLPVIMSDIPEHRYLNNKFNFGIILNENSPECLADAVLKLFSSKDLYDFCSRNSRKMSCELNWEDEFKKLIDFEYQIFSIK